MWSLRRQQQRRRQSGLTQLVSGSTPPLCRQNLFFLIICLSFLSAPPLSLCRQNRGLKWSLRTWQSFDEMNLARNLLEWLRPAWEWNFYIFWGCTYSPICWPCQKKKDADPWLLNRITTLVHSAAICSCHLFFSVIVFWSGPVGCSSVLLVGLWAGLVYSGLPSPLL